MRTRFIAAALATAVALPIATPALAQNDGHQWHGDQQNWDAAGAYREGNHRERRMTRDDGIYRGSDGRYYCRRNNGTTGLVIGAIGGGVLGNVLGGGTRGTVIGAGAGGLLGRNVERGRVRCR